MINRRDFFRISAGSIAAAVTGCAGAQMNEEKAKAALEKFLYKGTPIKRVTSGVFNGAKWKRTDYHRKDDNRLYFSQLDLITGLSKDAVSVQYDGLERQVSRQIRRQDLSTGSREKFLAQWTRDEQGRIIQERVLSDVDGDHTYERIGITVYNAAEMPNHDHDHLGGAGDLYLKTPLLSDNPRSIAKMLSGRLDANGLVTSGSIDSFVVSDSGRLYITHTDPIKDGRLAEASSENLDVEYDQNITLVGKAE